MTKFTHLHVHSHYSVLDGASQIEKLVLKAKSLGMDSIALTDHGAMYGIKEFYDAAIKYNIKPIIGIETYVARRSRFDKEGKQDASGYHLILLAKNLTGYKNLIKLSSLAFTQGFYYRPRIDRELLEQYHGGLIATSACLGGEIPKKIIQEGEIAAEESVNWYKNLFGDDFYLEMMLHPSNDPTIRHDVYEKQKTVNEAIKKISQKYNIKTIATNDVHFIEADDAESHDHLLCIVTAKKYDDPARMRYTRQEYLKSAEDMENLFADFPEAIENTREIVNKIESFKLESEPIMPDFPLPEGFTDPGEYLRHITFEGAYERWGKPLSTEIEERLVFELDTIIKMGYPGYFLIVADFIKKAREMGVIVGPGRGSAAGSAVAYACKITNIDPLQYELLFERFLNPDRISMPDIDIDFDDEGREKVLDYVVEKYGYNRVAHIITFGTMAAKMAIRDVGRNLNFSLPTVNQIVSLFPEKTESIEKAIAENPDLGNIMKGDDQEKKNLLKVAQKLEGTIRQTGTHACGIIIGKDDLENYIPVCKDSKAKLLITQYDGSFVESVGMLKMDFLGLKTLSIIKECLDYIKETKNIVIDIHAIPLDDKKTFELFGRGDTTALFQFESPGMKKHLKHLKPTVFEDLVAMNALYRPGPMSYIPSYINRKHGKEKIEYDHPLMETYLKSTYGITVYQEQVMLLSRKLANFTRGQSDNLRKAMGKKVIETMNKLKNNFIEGCLSNEEFIAGCKEKDADPNKLTEKIWHDWEAFAQYAFNKSHSVCYAYIAYQTAYLKAHYPSHYMAAVLSSNLNDIKKITLFMDEARRMGIEVFGPDINISVKNFTVDENNNVRFGLAAIKGVGENVVEHFVQLRKKEGSFKDIYDFAERVDFHIVNKRNIEALAAGGAFDSLGVPRSAFFANNAETSFIDILTKYGTALKNEKNNKQISLFGDIKELEIPKPKIPDTTEWTKAHTLKLERDVIGIYLSAHPLDEYKFEIEHFTTCSAAELANIDNYLNTEVAIAGIVADEQIRTTKNNEPYGRYEIEDFTGTFEFPLFRDKYKNYSPFLRKDFFVLVKGRVEKPAWKKEEGLKPEFFVKEIIMLSEIREKHIKSLRLKISLTEITDDFIDDFVKITEKAKGNILLYVTIEDKEENQYTKLFAKEKRVDFNNEFINFLNNYDIEISIN